ncbi:MAG: Omp28-related outer membrane protein [Odoribacter sp.]
MEKIVYILLILLLSVSCSKDETTSKEVNELVLTSDKTVILADGKDVAIFTVKDHSGTDVTGSCVFMADEKILEGHQFVANAVGVYKITARRDGLVSNEMEVKAVKEIEMQLTADKSKIMADGVDGVSLKLKSNLNEDVTTGVQFFVNGKLLENSFFTTTDAANYRITATYKGQPIRGEVVVAAEWTLPFVHRLLVEEYTSVACPNCPRVADLLKGFMEKDNRIITVAIHTLKGSSQDPFEKKPEAAELKKAFGVNSVPYALLNRLTKWDEREEMLLNAIGAESDIAIALDCKEENGQVKVTTKISAKKVFMGVKYIAVLVEDRVEGSQVNAPSDYRHHAVLRELSSVWGESVDVAVGRATTMMTTLSLSNYKKENCKVVVFIAKENKAVMNVQQVRIGHRVGY